MEDALGLRQLHRHVSALGRQVVCLSISLSASWAIHGTPQSSFVYRHNGVVREIRGRTQAWILFTNTRRLR